MIEFLPDVNAIIHHLLSTTLSEKQVMMINDLKYRIELLSDSYKSPRTEVDVVLITTVEIEFDAVQLMFNMPKKYTQYIDLHGTYNTCFDFKGIRVLHVHVGIAGPTYISIVCARLFNQLKCNIAILSGIAGGVDGKSSTYDVVLSTKVVDYEFVRFNPDGGSQPRHQYYETFNKDIIKHLNTLRLGNQFNKQVMISEGQKTKKYNRKVIQTNLDKYSIYSINTGLIASGHKLFANKTKQKEVKNTLPGNELVAFEMEGGGFCPVCNDFGINWIIVKGISDMCAGDKDEKQNKDLQFIAAMHATQIVKSILESLPKFMKGQ